MDAETGLESQSPEALREQIKVTQRELGNKIATLEAEVKSTASEVQNKIRDRIDSIRDVVDIRRHIEHRPVTACILAGVVGVIVAARFGGRSARTESADAVQDYGPERGGQARFFAPEIGALRAFVASRLVGLLAEAVRGRWASFQDRSLSPQSSSGIGGTN